MVLLLCRHTIALLLRMVLWRVGTFVVVVLLRLLCVLLLIFVFDVRWFAITITSVIYVDDYSVAGICQATVAVAVAAVVRCIAVGVTWLLCSNCVGVVSFVNVVVVVVVLVVVYYSGFVYVGAVIVVTFAVVFHAVAVVICVYVDGVDVYVAMFCITDCVAVTN